MEISNGDILVSYDVSSLFTNVPLDETIEILANRAVRAVIVSHKVKFSTLTIFNRPYCSFQHHLDGFLGRHDLAVFV